MTAPDLTASLASHYRIERELGAVHACLGEMGEARRLVALGIEQHEIWWQFAKAPAWAPFRADAEGAVMLRRHEFA